jgi:hypothetical protein
MSSRSIDAEEFQDFLANCRQRFVSHAFLRGLSSVVLITVGAILCAGLLDFLMPLPGYLRLILLVSTLGLSAFSTWKSLLRPLIRGISDTELGAAADLACPDLDEALATLVSVESPNASASEAGSALMRKKLWQQTRPRLTAASRVPVMEPGPTARRCSAATFIIIVTLVPLFAWQSGSLLLLQRFLLPLNNYPTATDLYFAIDAPGEVAARGDDVLFQARPMWRSGTTREPPSGSILSLESVSGHTDSLQMKYDPSAGCYTTTLRDVSSSLNWQISAGRALTEFRTLRVVDRPQLADALLTVTPPDYTRLAPQNWPGITGSMDALTGSQVKLTLTARKPVVSAELVWLNPPAERLHVEADKNNKANAAVHRVIPLEMHADGTSASVSFSAEHSGTFQLRLTDQYNLTNQDEQYRHLQILTDQPPQLSVRGIRGQETMRPDAIVPLNVVARDDIGLTSLELHIQQGDNDPRIILASDISVGDREIDYEYRTDLTELGLTQGNDVQLRVRVTDGCLPEPHEVWSDAIRIRIDSNAEPVGADAMSEATKQLVKQLQSVRRQLRKDAQTLNDLRRQSTESWTKSSQANTVRLSEQEQQHGRQLDNLAKEADRHPLMSSPATDLSELAQRLRTDIPQTAL